MNGALFRGRKVYRNSPSIGAHVLRARVTFSTGFACVRSRNGCGLLRGESVALTYILCQFKFMAHHIVFLRGS